MCIFVPWKFDFHFLSSCYLFVLEPKGKLGRRDTPRPADLVNRMNLRTAEMNIFNEEDEEENEEQCNDEEKDVVTEQKTITKVYEEVIVIQYKFIFSFSGFFLLFS